MARVSYFFPFIGHFLLFSSAIGAFIGRWIDISSLSAVVSIGTIVLLYYFGLLLFSIASIIYAIFCPTLIKKYGSEVDFVLRTSAVFSSTDLLSYSDLVARVRSGERVGARARGVQAVVLSLGIAEVGEDLILEVKKTYFQWQASRRAPARTIAAICYLVGIFMILIPTIIGIFNVLKLVGHFS